MFLLICLSEMHGEGRVKGTRTKSMDVALLFLILPYTLHDVPFQLYSETFKTGSIG